MISVPDAALLPSVLRPIPASNWLIMSGGKPCGYTGKRLVQYDARHFPMTGCGVLAGRSKAHISESARRIRRRRKPGYRAECLPRPRRLGRKRAVQSGMRAMLPNVSLPSSPYFAASGIAPMPTLSSTNPESRGERAGAHRLRLLRGRWLAAAGSGSGLVPPSKSSRSLAARSRAKCMYVSCEAIRLSKGMNWRGAANCLRNHSDSISASASLTPSLSK